jgi:hypothetical protein
VLLQIATAGSLTRSLVGDSSTATSPGFQYETPTPVPADATPTPTWTPGVPGNATPTPAPQNIPFSVASVGGVALACSNCDSAFETLSGSPPYYCLPQMVFNATTGVHVTDGAPGGTMTYHWISDLGPVTPVLSRTLKRGDGDGVSNFLNDQWTMSAALGDGTTHWVQVEVLTPNHVFSAREWFRLYCDFGMNGLAASGAVNNQFDCSGPVTQMFPFTGSVAVQPAPGGHSVTYHWQRYDGTTSPSYTIAVPAGATSVTLQQDSITISQSSPNGYQLYWDKVIIESPAPLGPPEVGTYVNKYCTATPTPSPTSFSSPSLSTIA